MLKRYHDTIRVLGLKFTAAHGDNPEEKTVPQPFEVDVEVKCGLSAPSKSDRLEDTLDYSRIIEEVNVVMTGPHRCLLEKLAGSIVERVGTLVAEGEITVRIRKPKVSAAVSCVTVEVEITRRVGT